MFSAWCAWPPAARSRLAGHLQESQLDRPPLPDDPTLRLVDTPGQPCRLSRFQPPPGDSDEDLATASRLAQPRVILAWAVLPALLIAGPGIYPEAWLILAIGLAIFVTPSLERNPAGTRRWFLLTLPIFVAAVAIQATLILGAIDSRDGERRPPLPPPGSPNVILIVLDTVPRRSLSLHGYERPTTPNLERLAARSVRFDQARAAAPWTLASHPTLLPVAGRTSWA